MRTVTRAEFLRNKNYFFDKIRKGAVFIYPTDTIYGIGCNALKTASVMRIRKIKQRPATPFSVVAPSKKWIFENCAITDKKVLSKLPGKYTIVLNLKNKKSVAKEVNKGSSSIGVRIPKNWFAGIVSELDIPVVTSSVNLHGKKPMNTLNDLDGSIAKAVDFVVYEGPRKGKPSTIIDLTTGKARIKKR